MRMIQHILFESLPLLLIVELIGMAILLAVHRRHQTPRTRAVLIGGLVGCVGLVGLQKLIVTDREALRELIGQLSRSVVEGDIGGLGEGLDDRIRLDFSHTGRGEDKPAVLQAANLLLQRYDVTRAGVSGVHVEVAGDEAKVEFQSMVDVRAVEGQMSQSNYPTLWKLHCVRKAGRWLVDEARGQTGIAGFTP